MRVSGFRFPVALVVFAALAAAKDKPVDAKHLPVVHAVAEPAPLEPFSRMTFHLDAQGRLSFDGKRFTINEFNQTIVRHTEFRGVHLKRKGKPALDDLGGDVKGSPVHVMLRVHKCAPWHHVAWLLMAMQEQRAYKSEFIAVDETGKEGVVRSWIPLGKEVEGGITFDAEDDEDEAKPPPPPPKGTVLVSLLAAGKREHEYGGKKVDAPASVTYAVGKSRVGKLKALRGRVKQAFGTAKRKAKSPRVEIRAGARVPFGEVVRVFDLLRQDGYERIEFGGLPIPNRRVRMAKPLPYPG